MIKKELSRKILTIGPDYSNHRGGIGAVLEVYSKNIEDFKFVGTYCNKNKYINIIYYLRQIVTILKILIKDRDIEIIHIHGASNGSFFRKALIFIVAKYLFGKKIVYHIHGAKYDIFYKRSILLVKILIRFVLEKSDLIICLSKSWARYFQNHYKIRRLKILNNVIDVPFQKGKNIKDYPISALFLGEIGIRKGIFDILDVIIENRNIFDGKFRIYVGGNGEINKLKTLIKDNNLEKIVCYIGWVNGEQKEKLLRRASIYILPSYHEGLPISILEAMSFGLPIISTDVGGISEIVRNKINGILLSPGDKEGIKQSLEYVIDNPSEMNKYGKESLRIVADYYPNTVFENLKLVYEELIDN